MIVALQIIRGLAALAVACAHLPWGIYRDTISTRMPNLTVTFSGVDVFFVLSGVVMAITIGPSRGFKAGLDFLYRRAFRVLPLYWIATCISMLQFASDYGSEHQNLDVEFFKTAVNSLFLIPRVNNNDPLDFYPIVVQGWTLEYEALFYVILSVAIACTARYRLTLASLIILGLCAFGSLVTLPTPLYQYTRFNSIEFVYGLSIGWAFIRGVRISPRIATAAILAGLIGLITFAPFSDELDAWRGFGWGLPAAAIVGASTLIRQDGINAIPSMLKRIGVSIGNASYSLYLIHTFVYGTWYYAFTGSRMQVAMSAKLLPVMLLTAIAGGLLAHHFVEIPLIAKTRLRLKVNAKKLGEER